jgi:hypothetical protein
VDVFICIPTTFREWESVREMERERVSRRLGKCITSVRKMRRVGPSRYDVNSARRMPSRYDVNSARRIRLRPSCDVMIRYRDARLRREVSKRW